MTKALRLLLAAAAGLAVGAVLSGWLVRRYGEPHAAREAAALAAMQAEETFAKAGTAAMNGDEDTAFRLYRDLVIAQPQNPEARYEFGVFLAGETKHRDLYRAIGELEAFLRLAPGSEKAPSARETLGRLLDRFKGSYSAERARSGSSVDAAELQRLRVLVAGLQAEVQDQEQRIKVLSGTNDELKSANRKLNNALRDLNGRIDFMDRPAPTGDLKSEFFERPLPESAVTGVSGTPEPGIGGPDETATYIVKRNDTLYKISAKVYGSPAMVDAIKAANPGVIPADGSVREGTEIKLPPRP